uniref:BHLH domain-containing protein n=1 Tax=Panagrolaimus sp. JU765 TaxID=591449 RepID=A0AC34PUT8_9BILA
MTTFIFTQISQHWFRTLNTIAQRSFNMNSLTIDQLLRAAQLFEQRTLQFGYPVRGPEVEDTLAKMAFPVFPVVNTVNTMNHYPVAYNSGNSTNSSLRSSPTSSMLSSGPTSPLQLPPQPSLATIRKSKAPSSKQSRAAHNELEKNRRANLRSYLDQIKDILPPEYDSSRDTTLSLLTRARNHIRQWRHKRDSLSCRKNELVLKNAKLRERIEEAKALRNLKRCRQDKKAAEKAQQEEKVEVIEKADFSPNFLELPKPTSPFCVSSKSNGQVVTIDPYLEGLLPPCQLLYPYPYAQQSRPALA